MASKNNTYKLKFDSARKLSPALESKSAAKINPQYDLFINGKFQKPLSGKYFDTINPATEEKLSEIAEANEAKFETSTEPHEPLCALVSPDESHGRQYNFFNRR